MYRTVKHIKQNDFMLVWFIASMVCSTREVGYCIVVIYLQAVQQNTNFTVILTQLLFAIFSLFSRQIYFRNRNVTIHCNLSIKQNCVKGE